ncbi:MAG: relaxase/mobilization nuclease domain-containing protein [Halarcobacter ebronensis]|uniref:relaxase/mobilization nuclease domain-containing protein n=1 Tax=Halarcobacter ebronensis TaxID=1462615 RepID=UPI003C76C913
MNTLSIYEDYLDKARKIKNQTNKSTIIYKSNGSSNFYYSSIPKEAVFKVVKDKTNPNKQRRESIKGYTVKKALEYSAVDKVKDDLENTLNKENSLHESDFKEKHISLETQDGIKLTSQEEIDELYSKWSETFTDRKNGKDAEHLVFSTKEPASKEVNEAILNAARETLKETLASKGFHYAFGIHNDTENTHVHAIVRSYNPETGKQLRIQKEDIREIKKEWANKLQENKLNYVVSLNIDRIKSMSDKLDYVKASNYSWFEANINKLKEKNVDEIGTKLVNTNKEVDQLKLLKDKKQKELQDIFYDKSKRTTKDQLRSEIVLINKDINKKYVEIRSAITLLNNLEYESQVANINYQRLKNNKEKITGLLIKQSKSYKELDKNVKEAYKLMLDKKIELDKAHIYLSKLNSEKKYDIDITTNKEVSYAVENIKSLSTNYKRVKTDDFITNTTLKKIDELNKSLDNNTTYLNRNMINELNTISNEFKKKNVLPLYNKEIRKIIDQELKNSFNSIKEEFKQNTINKDNYIKKINQLAKLKQDIKKNYDIPLYKLKIFNVDTEKFKTKETTLVVKGLTKLNPEDKEILYEELSKLSKKKDFKKNKLIKRIKTQIQEQDSLYQSQVNKLGLTVKSIEKKLGKSFEDVNIKQEVVHTEKTFVSWKNKNYNHIIIGKNFDYKKELQKLHNKKNLNNTEIEKLDIIREKALKNKDLESFDIVSNIDSIDNYFTLKCYGEVLQVSPKKINQEIWTEIFHEDIKDYKLEYITAKHNQELYNYNYKDLFIDKYLEKLKEEYLLQKDIPGEKEPESVHENFFNQIENFEKLCNDFKNEYIEKQNKENLIKETQEHLKDGNFIAANKNIKNFDKFERLLYLDKYYENAINYHANNSLDTVAAKIQEDSNVRDQSYRLEDNSFSHNKMKHSNTIEKPKEKKVKKDKIDITIEKKEEKKLNYGNLVKEQEQLKETLFNKIDKVIEKKEQREKDKINKIKLSTTDKTIAAAKSITYALKSNLKEIKDTQKFIDNLEIKKHKLTLQTNLNEYKKISVELNKAANNFISNVNNAKLPKEEKVKVLDQVFTTLDELNYTNEIKPLNEKSKELNQELIKRDISEFKHLNNKLLYTKDIKEVSKITSKSQEIFKRLKGTNLTFTQQLKIKSLQNKQHKQINKKQGRGKEL